jgi:RloB-like protein
MGRERRYFVRRSGYRDGTLFVIACEGDVTEPRYFDGLKERWHNPRVHIEVVKRDDASASSPRSVLGTLDSFAGQYMLRDGDQLWLVIDRDSQTWKPSVLAQVSRACQQKNYFLAVSNPCFELWLLLHFEDLPVQGKQRQDQVLGNKRESLKREITQHCSSKIAYIDNFLPHTDRAIARAKALDSKPVDRWPSGLGTRVYRLVEQLQPKTG